MTHRLARAMARLARAQTPQEIAEVTVDTVDALEGVDVVGVYLFEPATDDLVLHAVRGGSPSFLASVARYPSQSANATLIREAALQFGEAIPVPEPILERIRDEGLRLVSVVPFRYNGRNFGCINVGSLSTEALSPEVADAAATITAMAADALARCEADRERAGTDALFRGLFDTMAQGVIYQDATGRITHINPAALRALDALPEQLLGLRPHELPWEPLAADGSPLPREVLPYARALATGEAVRGVLMGVRHPVTGAVRWLEVDSYPSPEPSERRVHSVFTDVTEARAARDALLAQEARYRALVQASLDGFLAVGPNGRFVDVNDTYLRMLGHTREHLLTLAVGDVEARQDQPAIAATCREVREHGALRFETQHYRADGALIDVEVSAVQVPEQDLQLAFLRDLTASRRAAEALYEHERRYQAILQGAMDGFVVVTADGHVADVNEALCQLLGRSRAELLGTHVSAFLPSAPEAAPPALLVNGQGRVETQLLTARGTRVDAEVSAWMQPGSGAVLAFVRDLTERRRADAELRHAEERFRHAQKMEAVGRLAGGVAHDFNNLLTVINATAELALSSVEPTDPVCEDLQQIREAGDRAAALTRQLLTFSRRQVVQPVHTDVHRLLTEVRRMVERLVGEDIRVRTRFECQRPVVFADPGQLTQLVVNLVVNARDAMPRGGELCIETSSAELATADGLIPAGRYVVLCVTDTGSGMSPEVLEHIFEPFFTTKGDAGTGLGLATVYGILQQCQGHVAVQSTVGAGSRFTVHLPESPEAAQPAAEAQTARHARPGEVVLLVEDEPGVRRVVEAVLADAGYRVLAAPGGPEALALAAATPGAIDVVVSDVIMPHMHGPDVVARLRETRPTLRALFVSGYSDEVLSREGVLLPGVRFLRKPFALTELRQKVRQVLDEPLEASR